MKYRSLTTETKWNKFDEEFYLLSMQWFNKWKEYVAFDHIYSHLRIKK